MLETPWSLRIRDLQVAGLSYAEIATLTDVAPSTIGDLATGRSACPRGDAALKLHELHQQRCGVKSSKPRKTA
ncbi:MAG: helix-turn-helix transcriptional regulator [Proteobacteria bacterium]|nr:helix-turn-helix transcriptional regulator [Pseudomonadota bacterium]